LPIDVQEGDLLVLPSGEELPIVTVDAYVASDAMSPGFLKLATVTVSLKRSAVATGNLRGQAAAIAGTYLATQLFPVQVRPSIKTTYPDQAVKTLETFICDSAGFVRLEVEREK
jgi:hypothetical protein